MQSFILTVRTKYGKPGREIKDHLHGQIVTIDNPNKEIPTSKNCDDGWQCGGGDGCFQRSQQSRETDRDYNGVESEGLRYSRRPKFLPILLCAAFNHGSIFRRACNRI